MLHPHALTQLDIQMPQTILRKPDLTIHTSGQSDMMANSSKLKQTLITKQHIYYDGYVKFKGDLISTMLTTDIKKQAGKT